MELFLGMDGGGTGCRAAVADRAGRVMGRGEGGAANIWSDPEGALRSILAAAGAAAAEAGADPARLIAVLGLAGANMAGARTGFGARLPFASVRIETDAFVALKGALGTEDGIAVILGTGSVFGLQLKGEAHILGGWGFLLGDMGGGARIGRALLERALLAHDGFAATTPLLAATLAAHGGPEGIVAFGRKAAPADFAREVPRVLAAEAAGDSAARAVLGEAEAAVALAIDRLEERAALEAPGCGALPVCFLGGLGPEFARRLGPRYPGLVRPPRGSGVDGALAMARGVA